MSVAAHQAGSPGWGRLQRRAVIAGLAGLTVCALGLVISPAHFFRAYLVGYQFWLGIGLGCLAILMLQHLTGGTWGAVLRRLLESGSRTIPLLAVLFLPIALGMGHLFHWTHESLRNAWWLNVPFFLARAACYFAVWLAISYLLNRWSERQDRESDPRLPRRLRALSAPGLVLYGLTVTFASVDWAMSVEPGWYSTIYPVLFAAGQLLAGLAFAVAVLLLLATRPQPSGLIDPAQHQPHAPVLRDLGNLLLAFVMLWAYVSISQYLLIWSGNLPEENDWYLRRTRGGWQWVAVALAALHFGLPFLMLLSRDVKEHRHALVLVASLILVMRFLDVLWWIEPAFGGPYFFLVLDVAALVGLGGVWVWWFLWQLEKRPPLPLYDPVPEEAVRHE